MHEDRRGEERRGDKKRAGAPYPAELDGQTEHDEHVHVLLPHHPPEVLHRRGQRRLRRDVLTRRIVALQRKRRYVRVLAIIVRI